MSDDSCAPVTLADLGEDAILAAIFPRLPAATTTLVGPGDDAAIVAAPDGRVVATTDILVEGRDFRRDWSSAQDVGAKAAAQNLADIAAMGAAPTALLVGLMAPPDLPVSWVLGLADGLRDGCAGTGAGVVGGDLSSGPALMVSVTALGDLGGRAPVLRSGARVGDVVAVAGRLGWSAAGLALLQRGAGDEVPALVAAHRRPEPPYACGVQAAEAGATAMLDVSDGLVRDLGRLAQASGVGVALHRPPLTEIVASLRAVGAGLSDADLWSAVLSGGEDHALAATFPAGTTLPHGFVAIGETVPELTGSGQRGHGRVLLDGQEPDVVGWDHFRVSE